MVLRFHLHPAVKASRSQDGQTVMLVLPNGQSWAFEADGLPLALEESVFFAAADGLRRTEQIVVRLEVPKRAVGALALRAPRAGAGALRGRGGGRRRFVSPPLSCYRAAVSRPPGCAAHGRAT